MDAGFDAYYGQNGGAPFTGYGGPGDAGPIPGFPPVPSPPGTWTPNTNLPGLGAPTSEFLTSALVSRAIEQIAKAMSAGLPYFMALDFAAPHFPYAVAPGPGENAPPGLGPSDWMTLDPQVHASLIAQVTAAYGAYPPAGTPALNPVQARAAFKTLVAYMDVQIGRLMQHVDLKDTYVIFAGDNGTQGAGFNPNFNAVEPPNDAAKSKGTLYRNGVEVPFLIAGPRIKKKGRTSKALVTTTDIYATVFDLMGERQPKDTKGQSISFKPVLAKRPGKRKVNVAEFFNATAVVGGTGQGAQDNEGRVVADKRYRLLAKPVTNEADGSYVCRDDSLADPADDCFNALTGIYEKKIALEFYDTRKDPFETDALVLNEMNFKQFLRFEFLCWHMNEISRKAKYFQNGKTCRFNGSNLVDIDPTTTVASAQ